MRRIEGGQTLDAEILRLEMIERLLGGRRAEAGQQLQHPKARHRIARIVRPAQHRHHVLDVRRLQELEAAVFHVRNVALGEFHLEHIAVMRAAEQDGMALQRAADFTRRQYLAGDVLGLCGRIIHGNEERLLGGLARSQQGLAMLARAVRHQRIGRIQHLLSRSVVLRQNHHVGFRLEAIGKSQDVLDRGGAERVDGLGIVADHRDPLAVGFERVDDLALQGAGVLVLVDQHVVEILRQTLRQCRVLHHHMPVEQQIVEIQHAILLLAADIFSIQLREIRFPLADPRKLFFDGLFQR